jgi:hypothetical protein
MPEHGEVPERSNGAVSKTVVLLAGDRGFESLPLRQNAIHGEPQKSRKPKDLLADLRLIDPRASMLDYHNPRRDAG